MFLLVEIFFGKKDKGIGNWPCGGEPATQVDRGGIKEMSDIGDNILTNTNSNKQKNSFEYAERWRLCREDCKNPEISRRRDSYMERGERCLSAECGCCGVAPPKFMEDQAIPLSYYEQPNPYIDVPSCHINLLELSRYAKRCGKKLVELTREEVEKFST